MKKTLLLIFIIGQVAICNAQQFSFQMNFVDAVGNKDTITLGYDVAATDSIDTAFGETNIISTPYKSGLDVRIGNSDILQGYNPEYGNTLFETKKQIVPDTCLKGSRDIEINIVSKHYPIKAYWNKTTFNDTCRNGSFFTSVHPGGRWDTGGFLYELSYTDSAKIFENLDIYYYLNGTDTVRVSWVKFGDSTLLPRVTINEFTSNENSLKISPNPASKFLTVNFDQTFGEIKIVVFYNSFGQMVFTSNQLNNIDISGLPSGLYFVKVKTSNNENLTAKFLKVE